MDGLYGQDGTEARISVLSQSNSALSDIGCLDPRAF